MQQVISEAVEKFLAFAVRLEHNAWHMQPGVLEIYCRRGYRRLDDKAVNTFEIANVEVNSRMRGTGLYTELLESLKLLILSAPELHDVGAIYLENVLNARLRAFHVRQGFTVIPPLSSESTWPPSYYLMLNRKEAT